jgi:hypothetical protein
MKISKPQINVCTQSLSPTLQLYVNIEFAYRVELPISITGRIVSNELKIITYISEHHIDRDMQFGINLLTKSEKEKTNREHNNDTYSTCLSAELSPKAIEYMEIIRERDSEKSVQFTIEFMIKYMEIPVEPEMLQQGNFIKLSIRNINYKYQIEQSEWVRKYSPYLGIGKYLLLEFLIPTENSIPLFWKKVYDALSQNVKDMESCLRNGDWQKTMFFARKFYENAKIGDGKPGHEEFKNEFAKLMTKDQHCEQGVKDLHDGIWKLFEFYSKYSHDQDKQGNIKPLPVSRKEDAYFAYSTAIGLLNLIGSKINRE